VLFTIAMGLHFVLTDRGLKEHYPHRFRRGGRVLLAGALLVGWLLSALFAPSSTLLVALLTALLGGSILLNVFKEEIPSGRRSSFGWFLVGLVLYGPARDRHRAERVTAQQHLPCRMRDSIGRAAARTSGPATPVAEPWSRCSCPACSCARARGSGHSRQRVTPRAAAAQRATTELLEQAHAARHSTPAVRKEI
jgi:hypothetical protein